MSTSNDHSDREEGLAFQPKFDASGLVTCVATDATTGEVLMVAHMNDEALRKTIASGEAWYFSRACHTGRKSCFYRKVEAGQGEAGKGGVQLSFVDAGRLFDPKTVYRT